MIEATICCDQNHVTQMAPLPQQDCRCNQCNDAAKSKLFLLKENILWNLINNVNNCCKKFRKKEVRKYKYIYNVVSCSCLLLDTSKARYWSQGLTKLEIFHDRVASLLQNCKMKKSNNPSFPWTCCWLIHGIMDKYL